MPTKRQTAISRARSLRKDMTRAEEILWRELRGRHPDGYKFRRQHPEPPYIIDFAERRLKLAIEVDGATHSTEAELAYDIARTNHLKSKGWTVLRFGNEDVLTNLEYSLQQTWRLLADLSAG